MVKLVLMGMFGIGSAFGIGAVLCEDGPCPFSKGKTCGAAATAQVAAGDQAKDVPAHCAGAKLAAAREDGKPEGKPGCCAGKDKVATAAQNDKSAHCAGKGKATTTASASQDGKPAGCTGKGKLAAAHEEGKPGCCAGKGKTTTTASASQDGKPACHGKDQTASAGKDCQGKCPVAAASDAALAAAPKMLYRVGDTETACDKTAGQLAETTGKSLEYRVGEETFTDKGQATVKLASMLETYADSMTKMSFATGKAHFGCPVTAKKAADEAGTPMTYRVAGVDFDTQARAEQAVAVATEAAKDVKLVYQVGDKEYASDATAAQAAEQTEKKVTLVVGSERTSCKVTGQVNLAKARIRAIAQAVARFAMGQTASKTQPAEQRAEQVAAGSGA